jgi:hypothetical protein
LKLYHYRNFTAMLGVPPATDPRDAVKVPILAAANKGKL